MNENWKTTPIGNEIRLLYGKSYPSNKRVKGKFPVFGSNGIIDYSKKYLIEGPGVIIGRKGSVGEIHYSEDNYWPIDTTYYVKTSHNNFLKFWYYLFKYINLTKMNTHSAVPGLNREMVYKLECNIPSFNEQRKIAEFLSFFDEKIRVNTEINKNLKMTAQLIFKHWFIDFEFPNEQGKPYKSSGGEFIDSKLGKIPKGWGIIKFGDAINIFDSKRIPISSRERSKRKGAYPYYGATGILDYIDNYIFDGIYVLIGEDGSVIKENGRPFTQYVYDKFWVNNHAHIVQGKNNFSTEYIKLFLDHLNIYPYITGAVQLKLNQENLLNIKLISPPKKLLILFDSIIGNIFKKLIIITEQNRILSIIRDVLLPKLITGKIRVNSEDIKES